MNCVAVTGSGRARPLRQKSSATTPSRNSARELSTPDAQDVCVRGVVHGQERFVFSSQVQDDKGQVHRSCSALGRSCFQQRYVRLFVDARDYTEDEE